MASARTRLRISSTKSPAQSAGLRFCVLGLSGAASPGKGQAVAYEVCDPVESDSYTVRVDGAKVTVSNFVTPHWFDPQAKAGEQLDWLGKLAKPFTMTSGGYMVIMREGKTSQVFGDKYPAWRKATKRADTARTARRI